MRYKDSSDCSEDAAALDTEGSPTKLSDKHARKVQETGSLQRKASERNVEGHGNPEAKRAANAAKKGKHTSALDGRRKAPTEISPTQFENLSTEDSQKGPNIHHQPTTGPQVTAKSAATKRGIVPDSPSSLQLRREQGRAPPTPPITAQKNAAASNQKGLRVAKQAVPELPAAKAANPAKQHVPDLASTRHVADGVGKVVPSPLDDDPAAQTHTHFAPASWAHPQPLPGGFSFTTEGMMRTMGASSGQLSGLLSRCIPEAAAIAECQVIAPQTSWKLSIYLMAHRTPMNTQACFSGILHHCWGAMLVNR